MLRFRRSGDAPARPGRPLWRFFGGQAEEAAEEFGKRCKIVNFPQLCATLFDRRWAMIVGFFLLARRAPGGEASIENHEKALLF